MQQLEIQAGFPATVKAEVTKWLILTQKPLEVSSDSSKSFSLNPFFDMMASVHYKLK